MLLLLLLLLLLLVVVHPGGGSVGVVGEAVAPLGGVVRGGPLAVRVPLVASRALVAAGAHGGVGLGLRVGVGGAEQAGEGGGLGAGQRPHGGDGGGGAMVVGGSLGAVLIGPANNQSLDLISDR